MREVGDSATIAGPSPQRRRNEESGCAKWLRDAQVRRRQCVLVSADKSAGLMHGTKRQRATRDARSRSMVGLPRTANIGSQVGASTCSAGIDTSIHRAVAFYLSQCARQ